ncbi:MAG TPA: hypothetical protein VHP31_11995 [Caproicibacter sp.]|nr:hypothetical protein [Caproicibacter sp.]
MATNTASKTANYSLSQYAAGDLAKFLTNYNSDMLAIDAALKAIKDESDAAVPNTRKIAGLAMNADITLAQLISAGLCPASESGTWTPIIHGSDVAGSPAFTVAYANYCKLGKYVYIEAGITLSSKGGMAGWIQIGGLPFASAYENRLGMHRVSGISGISGPIVPVILGNTITPISESSAGSAWDVTADKITDTFSFALSGMYRAV